MIWKVYPGLEGTPFWNCYHRTMNERVKTSFTAYYANQARWYEATVFPAPDSACAAAPARMSASSTPRRAHQPVKLLQFLALFRYRALEPAFMICQLSGRIIGFGLNG